MQANRASCEVLRDYREEFTTQDAKDYNASARSAYSVGNCFCGTGTDTFCANKELLKSAWGIDHDPAAQLMYEKITGLHCFNSIEEVMEAIKNKDKNVAEFVAVMAITPPCQDYSTGNPDPRGVNGPNGGSIISTIPQMVKLVKPKVVFIEEVANLVNFVEVFTALLHGLHQCDMAVHAAVVKMTQYGDIENCWRLVIVAISSELGSFANDYKIPMGEFSDDVAYAAEHVATPTSDIPERFHRFMNDYEVEPMFKSPSKIRKVAQDALGFGHSSAPHACYDLRGLAPKCTTHGAGRHKPSGWKEGDGGKVSYMFTPDEVARHKNLPDGMMTLYRESYRDLGGFEQLGISEDEFLYKSMGNGFSAKFGTAMYRSIHRVLEVAGVPHDIIRSEVNLQGKVNHVQAAKLEWESKMLANQVQVVAFQSTLSSLHLNSGGRDRVIPLYEFCLDTGATANLVWDEQDGYLEDKVKSRAVVSVAKASSQFSITSQGNLEMAIIDSTIHRVGRVKKGVRIKMEDVRGLLRDAKVVKFPVHTAPRSELRKQLFGFPSIFANLKYNLDLRQEGEPGNSCMWYRHPQFPEDLDRRIEIPLRWDAIDMEWMFHYIPVMALGSKAKEAMVEANHADLKTNRGQQAVHLQDALDHPEVVDVFMIDLFVNGKNERKIQFCNVDQEVHQNILAKMPSDKRLEVVLARDPDERNERGVKQFLPTKEKRSMMGDAFHSWYGHVGSSKNCAFCRIIRGSMRFVHRMVDKYIETRMGYFWDMDTLTVNVRAADGTKYYTCLRDRGSKYIKHFSLQFKDHFIDCFEKWLTHMRKDKIYQVYNWDFCGVIKADNDGVWMRKSSRWLDLIDKFNIRMHYTNKDRKESNAHAERCMGLVETVAKGIQYERGLPASDHHLSVSNAVWCLNRFPTKASLARDSPDGDSARPLELLTMGYVSRSAINRQLSCYVMPGTIVFVHDAKAKGSDFSNPKAVIRIAKEMLDHQLVCFQPTTGIEMKTDSYTVVNPGSGINWRDQLGIKYTKPALAMHMPGDIQENANAKAMEKLCVMLLPDEIKSQLPGLKMMQKKDFIKHVQGQETITIRPEDLARLESEISRLVGEEKKNPTIEADDEESPESIDKEGLPEVAEGSETVTQDVVAPVVEEPSQGFSDPTIKKSLMNEEERANEKQSKKKPASAFRPSSTTVKPSLDSSSLDVKWLIKTKHPIEYQQVNPKRGLSFDRYERYKSAQTLDEARQLGATYGDLTWDLKKAFWWPIEHPTLPEAVASESGGQEGAQESSQQEEESAAPAKAEVVAVPVEEVAIPLEAKIASVETEEIKVGEATRIREWNIAIENHIFPVKRLSFCSMATKAGVDQALFGVYHKWLGVISGGELGDEQMGSITQKGMKCQVGFRFPKPSGSIWSRMVIDHYAPKHIKPEFEPGEEEAMHDGFARIRAMSALVRLDLETREIQANAARIRSKDGLPGIEPPPRGVKGLYSIDDDQRRNKFIKAFLKELNDLEQMGTISHLHTKAELLEKFGVDIDSTKPVSTLGVFDNKFPDGIIDPNDYMAKARLCVEGTPRQMKQGVHYDSVYAATPDVDSIFLMNALVVHLKLLRRAFDVGNAYGWGKQEKKLALEYPRGMAQFNANGEKMYMVLLKNTYGKPDGANLWYKERDSLWLEDFNNEEIFPGWSCRQLIMEQTLFEFKWSREVNGTVVNDVTYLLAWSDDCDMAGTSDEMMELIEAACHKKWKVKKVDPSFMLGVRRTLTIKDDVWEIHLTQTEFIDGLVGTWESEVAEAGFAKKSPETPIPPKTFFTAEDYVSEEEYTRVSKRGYKAVCGSLLWVARFCHCEIASSVSMCCRVMMKPHERAWKACMQIIAWLRDHKHLGVKFTSNRNEHGFVATSDASNKGDPITSKVMGSHTIQWMGGPLAHQAGKLPRIGAGSGANEFMALRIAAARVMKFRHLLKELGIMEPISEPTIIYCDSNVAINWVKTGKISKGNHYLDVDWHQPREWERDGHIIIMGLDTFDMLTDIGTKACEEVEFSRFLLPLKGHEVWVITRPRKTMTLT